MARIRTIKPDFFTSEDIVGLSPLARLLYIATWLEADREGRFVWRPKTLKLRYLPGDECDIDALALELVTAGLVVPYEIEGQEYAEIPAFTKHQVINNRESESLIPPRVIDASGTRALRVIDATTTPLVGREGKGKESTRTRRVSCDVDAVFTPFWNCYPKKVGKSEALKAWRKIKPDLLLQTQIMDAVMAQKCSEQWQKDGGQFIPHPATWLNQRRWEDGQASTDSADQQPSIFAGAI